MEGIVFKKNIDDTCIHPKAIIQIFWNSGKIPHHWQL
jgi:hypothetical protein